ncbi:uncharacterized protein LOC108465729 [Gossypium arboreum]|uniref:uncharacterized protein LOC108465729 n=1 Tax=Gossypium arboreum TaxID=29729 RepID=UPI0008193B34|nr:uncharacterized protein LOC108465729 [Gossypium arboreum]
MVPSLHAPPRLVASSDDNLIPNLEAVLFTQQDKLLASWLLSTVHASLLSYFISTKSAFDFWSTASHLFAATSSEKVSQIQHDLYATKKGGSTVKEYVLKIQTLCALLEASESDVLEAEKVEVLFAGLPPEFDSVFMLVPFSSKSLKFQKLVDILMGFEIRLMRAVHGVPMVAHVVEAPSAVVVVNSDLLGVYGRSFDRDYDSPVNDAPVIGGDGYSRPRRCAPEQQAEDRL